MTEDILMCTGIIMLLSATFLINVLIVFLLKQFWR